MSFSAADWVSAARIGLVPPMTAALWLEQREAALALYVLAPVSDLLDGHLARLGPPKQRQRDIDAVADIVFGVSLIGWAYWKLPAQRAWMEIYSVGFAAAVLLFAGVSLLLAGKVLLLHLWSGKLMAWIGFLWFGSSYFLGVGSWTVHAAAAAAIWFYIECVVYVARGRRDPNGRSAFF